VSLLQEMEDSCYWEQEEVFEQVRLSLFVVEGKSGKQEVKGRSVDSPEISQPWLTFVSFVPLAIV
jgi:hypothetical protein